MTDCHHDWTPTETGHACAECEASCAACNVCAGPTGNALLVCQRCLDRCSEVLDGITAALDLYLQPQAPSVGVMRYDTDRRGPSASRPQAMFATPSDIEDVLLSWVAMWTDLSGVAENAEPTAYLRSRHLWAAHNSELAAWDDYRREMRSLRHHARRLAGLLPQRQAGPCIYCGADVVRDWADEDWRPLDGLSDEVRCTGCRTQWADRRLWMFANRHGIRLLPQARPDSLVTREQARMIFPDVPPATWRDWVRRDARRAEGVRRWLDYLASAPEGWVMHGCEPEPERMPARSWDVRGQALYRLDDLADHVEARARDTRVRAKAG